ncbi:MAG: LCP family protein [Candidatus Promineifilaceae bacterium]
MAHGTPKRRAGAGFRLPLWGAFSIALGALVALILTSIWLVNGAGRGGLLPFGRVAEGGVVGDAPSPAEDDGLLPAWQGSERVSILLLGIDPRCDEEGPSRSDTLMVLSIDPVGKTAVILSIPRDLWVEIPNHGENKINQAYFMGDVYNYPGGGPALAVATVEAFLDEPLAYYATVNFEAFVELVDEVGGVDVTVTEAISDPSYPDRCYGFEPFYINAGLQHLDGEAALKYARTRASVGGDVDRADRQQQVLLALRDKLTRLDMAPELLLRAPDLWRIFRQNVTTNLTLEEAIALAQLAQEIPAESIRRAVINYDYVDEQLSFDGQQVLIPRPEALRALFDELFAPPAIPTPVIENLPQLMAAENARIAIHNGTPTFGLAAATQAHLLEQGFNVVEIGNADSAAFPTTQVIDYGSHRATSLYLAQVMGIPAVNLSTSSRPAGTYDVLVILGADWQPPEGE